MRASLELTRRLLNVKQKTLLRTSIKEQPKNIWKAEMMRIFFLDCHVLVWFLQNPKIFNIESLKT
jgi:hypothetical protein